LSTTPDSLKHKMEESAQLEILYRYMKTGEKRYIIKGFQFE